MISLLLNPNLFCQEEKLPSTDDLSDYLLELVMEDLAKRGT